MSESSRNPVVRHPNASMALGSGAGLGPVVVWSVGLTGTPMPAEVGAAFGGVLAAFFLLLGKGGVRGLIGWVWRGETDVTEAA